MVKGVLHLSVDVDLIVLAKASGLNLSGEFEEWIRIRLGQVDNMEENNVDYDMEIAKLHQELARLQSKKQLSETKGMKVQEEVMVIDNIIDNALEFKTRIEDIPEKRFKGLIYLYNKKFHRVINGDQAKALLSDRIKERGLIVAEKPEHEKAFKIKFSDENEN